MEMKHRVQYLRIKENFHFGALKAMEMLWKTNSNMEILSHVYAFY